MVNTAKEPVILAQPVILIISSDEDFAKPLVEQVTHELGLACAIADSYEGAKPLKPSFTLVITNEAVADNCQIPVLRLKEPPFRMREILNEIVSIRQKQTGDDIVLGRGYRLQPRKKELLHIDSGKSVLLTDKEVKLLQNMAEDHGKIVSKEQLLKQVWDMDADLDTHTLETHIYRMRTKFRELGGDDDIIVAGDGGYKLMEK